MEMMSLALKVMGCGCLGLGGIWLLIEGFKQSTRWGLAILFMGFVSVGFVILHWPQAKRPFFIQLLGAGLLVAGMLLSAKMGQTP